MANKRVMSNTITLKNSEVRPAYGKIKIRKSRLSYVFKLRVTKAEAKLLG